MLSLLGLRSIVDFERLLPPGFLGLVAGAAAADVVFEVGGRVAALLEALLYLDAAVVQRLSVELHHGLNRMLS